MYYILVNFGYGARCTEFHSTVLLHKNRVTGSLMLLQLPAFKQAIPDPTSYPTHTLKQVENPQRTIVNMKVWS